MSETKLPKRFVILRDADNPLWDKYIEWLNRKYDTYLNGNQEDCYGKNINPVCGRLDEFADYTILTLEQWDAIVNGSNYEVSFIAEKPSDNDAVLKAAIEKWGKERQLDKVIEEMSELTKAILKYRHADKDNINKVHALQDLSEEHADVLLTLGYLSVIFGEEYTADVHKRMNFKIESLKHKLKS